MKFHFSTPSQMLIYEFCDFFQNKCSIPTFLSIVDFEHACCITVILYLFKGNNKNTSKRCGISSELTIKTPKRHFYGVLIVIFEHISNFFLVFLFFNLSR